MYTYEKINQGKVLKISKPNGKFMLFDMDKFIKDENQFVFDLSDYAIGIQGKPVKKFSIAKDGDTILKWCNNCVDGRIYHSDVVSLQILDSALSLGYRNFSDIHLYYGETITDKEVKDVLRKLSTMKNTTTDYADTPLNFHTLLQTVRKENRLKLWKRKYKSFFDYVGNDDKCFEIIDEAPEKTNTFYKIYYNSLEWWHNDYCKLHEFILENSTTYRYHSEQPISLTAFITTYLRGCEAMHTKPCLKPNLLKEIQNIRRYTQDKKISLWDDDIKQWQTEQPLYYANSQYETFIPTSQEDFIEEGAYMHNCMGQYELDEVKNRQRKVAFIRPIGESNSVANVDLCPVLMNLCQKRARYNNPVEDESVLNFIQEYQEYLHTLIKK